MFSRNSHHDVPRHRHGGRPHGSDCSSTDSLGSGLRCSRREGFGGLLSGGRMSQGGLSLGRGRMDEGAMFHPRRGSMGGLMGGMDGLGLGCGGLGGGRSGGGPLGRRMGSQPGSPHMGRGSGLLDGRGMMDPRGGMFERPGLGLDSGFSPRGRIGGRSDLGGFERGPMMSGGLGGGGFGGGGLGGGGLGGGLLGCGLTGGYPSAESLHSMGSPYSLGHLDRQPRAYHYQPPFFEDEIDEEMLMHQHMMAMGMIPDEYFGAPFFGDPRGGAVI